MKTVLRNNLLKSVTCLLISGTFLSGFSLSWLNRKTTLALPPEVITLSEKQAHWSRFLGYGPEHYATQLSASSEDNAPIVVKQARRILALTAANGQVKWRRNLSRYTLTNAACIAHKRILIATNEPRLLALDADTGDVLWSTPLPHMVTAKASGDQEHVFVKTMAGDLIAINAKNGKILWHYKHKSPSIVLNTSSAPKLTKDKLLAGFSDGKLIAFNRVDGKLLWEHTFTPVEMGSELEKLVDIAADPIVDTENAVVYVSAYHSEIKCLSLDTGNVQWSRPFSGYMPLVLNKYLYSLDDQYVLHAFDPLSGVTAWTQTAFKDHQAAVPGYQAIGPVMTSSNKHLVIADQEGNVYWLSLEDGKIIGKASFNVASSIVNLPLTHDKGICVINKRSQVAFWKNPTIPALFSNTEPQEKDDLSTKAH